MFIDGVDFFLWSSGIVFYTDSRRIVFRFVPYLQAFQLFMLFWITNFIVALGQMTMSGAFASYYWAFRKPKDIPLFPVTASLGRALRYVRVGEGH